MSLETLDQDRQNKISLRAYSMWEEEGRPDGAQERHWREAEALEMSALESEGATQASRIPDAPPSMSSLDADAEEIRNVPRYSVAEKI